GLKTEESPLDRVGPNYQPSNKGGSSRMEATVINSRLGMGHTGAERGDSSGWLTGNRIEMLAVRSDIKGGTEYVRPTLDACLDGGVNGYNITGPGVLAHIGDPKSAPPELGGLGWMEPFTDANGNCSYDNGEEFLDINGNGVRDAVESRPGNLNPAMRNQQAAAYINNFRRSVEAFIAIPDATENFFTPGEFMATNYILTAAAVNVPQDPPPLEGEFIPTVPNPAFNAALYEFVLNESGNVLGTPRFQTFNDSVAGSVPTRTSGIAYSDAGANGGSATGQYYVSQAGTQIQYASAMSMRNKIAGDFNNDGLRNLNDASEMVAAWRDRNGGPAWQSGTAACVELLGDFNCDGNFDAADVRYWADGLAMDPGTGALDRRAGFEAVDTAFGGNFFGTTIVHGRAYQTGDSRADIAGGLPTVGFAPNGADGVIDNTDLLYVKAQFTNNPFVTDGEANWDDTAEAVGFDLSADITGDLKVNNDDVLAVQRIICVADFNGSNSVNTQDVLAFLNAWNAGSSSADINLDGNVNTQDVLAFLNLWNAGC
ncbi:MAG: GC-type dockerin domain-anchored protein, partial [Phycisphaerales bacterium JB041]